MMSLSVTGSRDGLAKRAHELADLAHVPASATSAEFRSRHAQVCLLYGKLIRCGVPLCSRREDADEAFALVEQSVIGQSRLNMAAFALVIGRLAIWLEGWDAAVDPRFGAAHAAKVEETLNLLGERG